MDIRECIFLIMTDLERYQNTASTRAFIKEIFWGRGFKYIFWFRINQYIQKKPLYWFPIVGLSRLILRHFSFKLGIDISLRAVIGPGLKIEHFGNIFVNGKAHIGKHCSIAQGVTIGEYFGAPYVGDYVFIGPGAKLIGGITIGQNSIIGANCVVTENFPENSVIVGMVGKAVSYKGNLRGDRKEGIIQSTTALYRKWCPMSSWGKFGLE